MKTLILIMTLFGIAGATSFKVCSLDRTGEITAIIDSLAPVMNKPMEWCTIEAETLGLEEKNEKDVFLTIGMHVVCDSKKSNDLVNRIFNKYEKVINENSVVFDSIVNDRYPDLTVQWGMTLNDFKSVNIKYERRLHNMKNDMGFFFNINVNGNKLNEVFSYEYMSGQTFGYVSINNGRRIFNAFEERPVYIITVPKKWLADEIVIETNRIWHLDRRIITHGSDGGHGEINPSK